MHAHKSHFVPSMSSLQFTWLGSPDRQALLSKNKGKRSSRPSSRLGSHSGPLCKLFWQRVREVLSADWFMFKTSFRCFSGSLLGSSCTAFLGARMKPILRVKPLGVHVAGSFPAGSFYKKCSIASAGGIPGAERVRAFSPAHGRPAVKFWMDALCPLPLALVLSE